MATRKRLKTETQLITRKNNERAYAQALHSILYLSGKLNSKTSVDMESEMRESIFTYTDTLDFNGIVREEWYTAFVQHDCIHIKISFIQDWNEPSEDNGQGIGTVEVHMPNYSVKGEIKLDSPTEPDFDWSKLENKEPRVLGKIDLSKRSK